MNFAMPVMDPCPFCEIANRDHGDWSVIERTSLTLTLLNGRQYEAGQCIVLPLRHVPTLFDLNDVEGAAVMHAAQRVGVALTRLLAPEGLLLYQNNGLHGGQEVPHFHLHVVPRTPGSDWGLGPPHLARVAAGTAAAHLDYRIATDEKITRARAIAAEIRGS
jgi:diadenosine tetraphosphate (Ap4A) HIT family hydrolase